MIGWGGGFRFFDSCFLRAGGRLGRLGACVGILGQDARRRLISVVWDKNEYFFKDQETLRGCTPALGGCLVFKDASLKNQTFIIFNDVFIFLMKSGVLAGRPQTHNEED